MDGEREARKREPEDMQTCRQRKEKKDEHLK